MKRFCTQCGEMMLPLTGYKMDGVHLCSLKCLEKRIARKVHEIAEINGVYSIKFNLKKY